MSLGYFVVDYMTKLDLIAVYDSCLQHFEEQAAGVRSLDNDGTKIGKVLRRNLGLNLYETMSRYLIENRNELFDSTLINELEGLSDD